MFSSVSLFCTWTLVLYPWCFKYSSISNSPPFCSFSVVICVFCCCCAKKIFSKSDCDSNWLWEDCVCLVIICSLEYICWLCSWILLLFWFSSLSTISEYKGIWFKFSSSFISIFSEIFSGTCYILFTRIFEPVLLSPILTFSFSFLIIWVFNSVLLEIFFSTELV